MSIDDEFLNALRKAVSDALGLIPGFEKTWETLEQDYRSYILELLPLGSSGLTRHLNLLGDVGRAFGVYHLMENKQIAELVMEGALGSGDEVIIHGVSYIILSRRISPNFGILYELVSKSGDIIYHEFID